MKALETTGALAGLKVAHIDDLDRYKAAVERGRQTGWGYYFPYLLSVNRPDRSATLMSEEEGSICVFRWRVEETGERLDLHLPPIPMNAPVLGAVSSGPTISTAGSRRGSFASMPRTHRC